MSVYHRQHWNGQKGANLWFDWWSFDMVLEFYKYGRDTTGKISPFPGWNFNSKFFSTKKTKMPATEYLTSCIKKPSRPEMTMLRCSKYVGGSYSSLVAVSAPTLWFSSLKITSSGKWPPLLRVKGQKSSSFHPWLFATRTGFTVDIYSNSSLIVKRWNYSPFETRSWFVIFTNPDQHDTSIDI